MKVLLAGKIMAGLAAIGSGDPLVQRDPLSPTVPLVAAASPDGVGISSAAVAAPGANGVTAGCRSRSASRPWGTLPSRKWTPLDTTPNKPTPNVQGSRTGSPFDATLILAYGIDTEFSARSAIFEFPDGCRRQYLTKSLDAADNRYIDEQIAAHPYGTDPATYATSVAEEGQVTQAQVDAGTVKTYQTQHFNIMYGVNTKNFSYTYQAGRGVAWDDFLKAAGKTMEDGWLVDRFILDAPMPYRDAAVKKKINVYICGTGLPYPDGDTGDCGASAGPAVWVSSVYLQPGSTTMWHEFGHAIQFYTGGFRDRPEAGPAWETNADFIAFNSSPSNPAGVTWYYNNLEEGPFWSVSRYGAQPVMTYLFENDATRGYVWKPWTENLRTEAGVSTEDFGQALVRLGQAGGIFPNGYRSFADLMGWYGARLTTGDFVNGKALLDHRISPLVAKLYAPLTSSGGGAYASPVERPLMQWGTHIVPLTPSNATMTARLTGATAAGSAAWRYFIVSVAADGTPRYSAMGVAEGTVAGTRISLPRVSGETAYLVVTATPYAYQVLGWQDMGKPPSGNKFPYRIKIGGAAPLTIAATACNSVPAGVQGRDLNYNTNGYSDQPKAC